MSRRPERQEPPPAPPVFLLGAARSGTSLLYKALCLHPDASWISNWTRRVPAHPAVAVLNRVAGCRAEAQTGVWFGGEGGSAYVYGGPRPATRRWFPQPVEGEPFFARCGVPGPAPGLNGREPDPETLQSLRAAVSALVRWSGGRVFVSKRVGHNWRIPLLAAAFPDARFVELVRDGRAVALSLSRVDWWEDSYLPWAGGTPREHAAAGWDPWELCAANWVAEVRAVREGLGAVPAERHLRITYEEFVARPRRTLERVGSFAGFPACEAWDRRLARLSFPDANDKWRLALDAAALARVEAVAASTLVSEGYSPDRVHAAGPGGNSRAPSGAQVGFRNPPQTGLRGHTAPEHAPTPGPVDPLPQPSRSWT